MVSFFSSFSLFSTLFLAFGLLATSLASPYPLSFNTLERRTDPYFPDQPPSCQICAQSYPSINSCAQACTVLANFSMVIFNPGAFISVIECACTDTFQAAFPQCVDCFTKTNQTDVLNDPDLPSVLTGVRNVCAIASTLLGNTSDTDGETTPTSAPTPTATSGAIEKYTIAASLPLVVLSTLVTLGVL